MTDMNVSVQRIAARVAEQVSNANPNVENEDAPSLFFEGEDESNVECECEDVIDSPSTIAEKVANVAKEAAEKIKGQSSMSEKIAEKVNERLEEIKEKVEDLKKPSIKDALTITIRDLLQKPEVDSDVAELDADGDGKITKEELLNYGSGEISRNPWDKDDDMKTSFDEYSDGQVYNQAMNSISEEQAKKYEEAGLKVFNINGKYLVSTKTMVEYGYENTDISRRLDKDDDGVITKEEVMDAYLNEYDQKIIDDSKKSGLLGRIGNIIKDSQ